MDPNERVALFVVAGVIALIILLIILSIVILSANFFAWDAEDEKKN